MSDKTLPAFPTMEAHGFNSGMPGMTLRDYFAAKVAEGDAAAGDGWSSNVTDDKIDQRAELYYRIADSMLNARGQ